MKYLKFIAVCLSSIRLLPHILFLVAHSQKAVIISDVKANSKNNSILFSFLHLLTFENTFRNLFYFRIGKVHWLFSWLCPRCSDLFMLPNMKIGKSAKFTHNHTTHINATSIGDNFECLHLVTIGAWKGKIPTLGNNVKVYCGAMILGGVSIGNNVNIGAGAVVTKDVPDNCTVIGGGTAKIIKLNGDTVNISL